MDSNVATVSLTVAAVDDAPTLGDTSTGQGLDSNIATVTLTWRGQLGDQHYLGVISGKQRQVYQIVPN